MSVSRVKTVGATTVTSATAPVVWLVTLSPANTPDTPKAAPASVSVLTTTEVLIPDVRTILKASNLSALTPSVSTKNIISSCSDSPLVRTSSIVLESTIHSLTKLNSFSMLHSPCMVKFSSLKPLKRTGG